MPSYFTLVLDTTAPTVTIDVPASIGNVILPVTISADEPLDNYQEIYFIDSEGNRFDSEFTFVDGTFEGNLDFSNASIGTATIYAHVRDEVHNEITAQQNIIVIQTYFQKSITYTDDDAEVTSVTIEAGDTRVLKAHIKEYNPTLDQYLYFEPDSAYAVVEKYEDDTFTTVNTATALRIDTGIYKIIFTAPYQPGIFYLKTVIDSDGYEDFNRLKVRVRLVVT